MPTYAYRGSICAHEFETVQKFADASLTECIVCGGPVRRVFQPVGVVFKGSGWYINDSRSSKDNSSSNEKSEAPATTAQADSKAKPSTSAANDSTTAPAAKEKESVKSAAKSAD